MVLGLLAVIFAGVGLLEVLVALVVWLLPEGAAGPAVVVDDFYAALMQQTYTLAWQSVDAAGGTVARQLPLSAPMTVPTAKEFIAQAQAADAAFGAITRYSLARVQASRSQRVYTLRVRRASGAAYRARLRVARRGASSAWKIVGIDRL